MQSTRFSAGGSAICTVLTVVSVVSWGLAAETLEGAASATEDVIQLDLSPRICSLSGGDKQCRARRPESLCLIILERSEVRRCWENYLGGTFSMELVFADDLAFQLTETELRRTITAELLRVIHEAIHYRRKCREPWNVFE